MSGFWKAVGSGAVTVGKKIFKPKVSKTITSVPPNVPKTSTQKIKRDLNLLKHEISGKMKKMSQDVSNITDDFKKGVRKFKKKD